jgi:phosphoribosylformylglycinamidine synthase
LALLSVRDVKVVQHGLGASEYLAEVCGIENGRPVAPNMAGEKELCDFLAQMAEKGLILAAHDLSEGGLAFAAAETTIVSGRATEIVLPASKFSDRTDANLFGEVPGRVLVAVADERALHVLLELAPDGLICQAVGEFGGGGPPGLSIHGGRAERSLAKAKGCVDLDLTTMKEAYEGAIPAIMKEVLD